jgi:hypothetical protein
MYTKGRRGDYSRFKLGFYTASRARGILENREISKVTTPAVLSEYRRSELVWDFMRLGLPQRILSLAGFGVVYSLLVMFGLELRESSQQLTIIWPAAVK